MPACARKIRVLDGSFATELCNVVPGYFDQNRPNWTFDAVISDPQAVATVHKRFIDAGVDDITTNTYHASLPCLREQGLQGPTLIEKAALLLKEISSNYCPKNDRRIWGAIGSYATCFRGQAAEYTGSYVDAAPYNEILKTLTDYHKEQIEAIVAADINNLLFETVSSLTEAKAISDALNLSDFKDVNAIVSFTCKKDGFSVCHGEPFKEAVKVVLANSKVVGFGINCTHAIAIAPLLKSVQSLISNKEIFIYPNNGQHEQDEKHEDPIKFILGSIEEWIRLGATTIGGCCGISADTIREIRKRIDSLPSVE